MSDNHPVDATAVDKQKERLAVSGILEIAGKGFGFLRVLAERFEQKNTDVFVTPQMLKKYHLRGGYFIEGIAEKGNRGEQLLEVHTVNHMPVEKFIAEPQIIFEELKAISPQRKIILEKGCDNMTARLIDFIAPIGFGQRGLIVAPPRSGKTTILHTLTEAMQQAYHDEITLMTLLIDERPEEVTEYQRSFPDVPIFASSNDEKAKNHCRMAKFCLEHAKRLVEQGKDVVILMDSITRLARASNQLLSQQSKGKGRGIQSGGLVAGALEMPRRIFSAARNTRESGSLTIIATALIETNAKADEAIFHEFKGTGNMELVLNRNLADKYIYPAVDIFKSGTRRDELLLPEHVLHKSALIRRSLANYSPEMAIERLLLLMKKFANNNEMFLSLNQK